MHFFFACSASLPLVRFSMTPPQGFLRICLFLTFMQLFVLREGLCLTFDQEFFASVDNYMLTMGEMLNVSEYPSTSEMEEYDTNRHISKILILSTFPFILLIGTVGNLLTFIIMQRGSLKHSSTCFYMAILALADSSKCNTLVLGNVRFYN